MDICIALQKDELTKEVFNFRFIESNIILETYTIWAKATKRSSEKVVNFYNKANTRDSTILECNVPLTPEIREQAFQQFVSKVKVLTWAEYKNK